MNVPVLEIVRSKHHEGLFRIAVVTSGAPDRFPGCYWHLYDGEGKTVSWGSSKGWDGNGAGSVPSAMRLAKAAAKRRDRKGDT